MIYFDNAATTFAYDVGEPWRNQSEILWFNSNAGYAYKSAQMIDGCRERIRECLGVYGGKVIFTRCATESAELFARLWPGDINCSAKEHDSVHDLRREGRGVEVWIQQTVNQVTGEIFDIEQISKEHKFIALDMTAGIGKVTTEIPRNCQAVWFSGHKFHGPHMGVLWLKDDFANEFATQDSRNQYGILHGTLDCPRIIALTNALEEAVGFDALHSRNKTLLNLSAHLYKKIYDNNLGKMISNDFVRVYAIAPYVLNDINADALQQYLAWRGIYIGLGASACAGSHNYRVLCAGYGLSVDEAQRTIRISFDFENTTSEIDEFIDAVKDFRERFSK